MPQYLNYTVRVFTLTCALGAGAALCGCHGVPEHTLGVMAVNGPLLPMRALATTRAATPVVVQGEMIEKCPVAGCWFVLKDKSGVVRVDTKGAGFVVSDVPLHARLTVAGAVTGGAQPGIAATGVRY